MGRGFRLYYIISDGGGVVIDFGSSIGSVGGVFIGGGRAILDILRPNK